MTNNLTASDARERWGDPNRIEENEVERACPWCATWLRNDGKAEGLFDKVVECKNMMCPLLPTGGCYWEPWPDGWTDQNTKRAEKEFNELKYKTEDKTPQALKHLAIADPVRDAEAREYLVSSASINGEKIEGIKSVTIEGDFDLVESITWSKLTRLKQLLAMVFRPWKVWDLHDKLHRKEDKIDLLLDRLEDEGDQIDDLLNDIAQAIEQRDEASAIARKLMMKKEPS